MQMELRHLQRIDKNDTASGRAEAMEKAAEHDTSWRGKVESPERCLMDFQVTLEGIIKVEDLIDAVEHIKGTELQAVIRRELGFGIVLEADWEDWRQLRKGLAVALNDVEEIKPDNDLDRLLYVDVLHIEFGLGLVPVVNEMLPRISYSRKVLAFEYGIVMPAVRFLDNNNLGENEYTVHIHTECVGRGSVRPHKCLAMDPHAMLLVGEAVLDPTFEMPARWIDREHVPAAEAAGLTVVEAPGVINTHFLLQCKKNAHQLFGIEQMHDVCRRLKMKSPHLVQSVCKRFKVAGVHKIFVALLQNDRSVKQVERIFETIASATIDDSETIVQWLLNILEPVTEKD